MNEFFWKYLPDLKPNPESELNVMDAKKVHNPTNMSTTRAGFWFAMLFCWRVKVHKRIIGQF